MWGLMGQGGVTALSWVKFLQKVRRCLLFKILLENWNFGHFALLCAVEGPGGAESAEGPQDSSKYDMIQQPKITPKRQILAPS